MVVLAGELLREAEKLIAMRLHPQTIVEGYRLASAAALKALEASAVDNGSAALTIGTSVRSDGLFLAAPTQTFFALICSTSRAPPYPPKYWPKPKATLRNWLLTRY